MSSSGDLLADRRYAYAQALFDEGDFAGAADLARQCVELAPAFSSGWFLLGKAVAEQASRAERDADRAGLEEEARSAFRETLRLDPEDREGAALRLACYGEADPERAMSPAYVRSLFDEYATRFDRHLVGSLRYRGPAILHDAVRRSCSRLLRPFSFRRCLDLGCGTGLAGEAFRDVCRELRGADLSPEMIRRAERKRVYDGLAVGDLLAWLDRQPAASTDLVLAADVFVYVADLLPILLAIARALAPDGLLAFTVQTHEGEGITLGEDLR